MRLQDYLAQELLDQVTGGATLNFSPAIGQNTFIGHMPSGIDEGLLFAATSPLNKNQYTTLFTGGAQILFRCNTYDRADLIMRQISDIFNGYEFENSSVRVLKIQPRHEPFSYPRLGTGGFEASVNFDVTCSFK